MIKTISILGCGWLGLPLAKQLVQAGYTIKGATTTPEKLPVLKSAGIAPYLIKVTDRLEGDELGHFFDTDLLFVNIPPGGRRDPKVANTYPQKIAAIAKMAVQKNIANLIFISSTSVYGNDNSIVDESTATNPVTASGKGLVAAEQYLEQLDTPQATILRMAGLVGGSRKPGRFLAGKKNLPNGSAPVNLVHLEDCVALITSLIKKEAFGAIFNVAADGHPEKAAFYTAQALNDGLTPPTFNAEQESEYKIISNARIKSALNYKFIHPDPMDF